MISFDPNFVIVKHSFFKAFGNPESSDSNVLRYLYFTKENLETSRASLRRIDR